MRSRGLGVALAGLAMTGGIAAAGEFPTSNIRAYCDSNPPPDTYWGAREIRGDLNNVVVGFSEAPGAFEVHVENTGIDREGIGFEADTSCSRSVDSWRLFEANLGLRGDSVRLSGIPAPDPAGPVPARIAAEVHMGSGADTARGHAGKDRFDGGPGRDTLRTLGGRDKIFAADGARDKVRCGRGRDRAIVDGKDDVGGDCERVKTL